MANAVHRGVVDDLGRRITAGTVAPGAVFTVARLEADYQVSRTVVREAVRVLESLRLVESRRRVGLRVRPRDEWCALDPQVITWSLEGPFRQRQLAALMELRVAIEPVAAELAATRASTAQRAELNRLAEQLRFLGEQSKGNDPEFLAADLAFHDTLLLASGNRCSSHCAGRSANCSAPVRPSACTRPFPRRAPWRSMWPPPRRSGRSRSRGKGTLGPPHGHRPS